MHRIKPHPHVDKALKKQAAKAVKLKIIQEVKHNSMEYSNAKPSASYTPLYEKAIRNNQNLFIDQVSTGQDGLKDVVQKSQKS